MRWTAKRAIRQYFEAVACRADGQGPEVAAKRGEVGLLDFDPFIDAQEWEISEFDIALSDTARQGDRDRQVRQSRQGDDVVTLDLVKIKSEWRVSDITWLLDGKSETLRGIYVRQ